MFERERERERKRKREREREYRPFILYSHEDNNNQQKNFLRRITRVMVVLRKRLIHWLHAF